VVRRCGSPSSPISVIEGPGHRQPSEEAEGDVNVRKHTGSSPLTLAGDCGWARAAIALFETGVAQGAQDATGWSSNARVCIRLVTNHDPLALAMVHKREGEAPYPGRGGRWTASVLWQSSCSSRGIFAQSCPSLPAGGGGYNAGGEGVLWR
jgi:hypothetical protein